jgi:hypothetical protein
MKLDFTNVINKLPTVEKAVRKPAATTRPTKTVDAYPQLGDEQRFKAFPETVDGTFISLYRQSLDEFLVPYIQQGEMKISAANRFIDNLVDQVFGTTKYFGLFSYLKERNYENSAERELVRTSERLINSGWRVVKDKNTERYKIINSEGSVVIDATGPSEFSEEASAVQMDASSSHVFIDGENAAKIEALAFTAGQNADSLNSINSLTSLMGYTEDKKVHGIIINQSKLKNILRSIHSYPILSKGKTFSDLYGAGYTLSDKMIFSHEDRLVMHDGKNDFVIYCPGPEINQNYGVHKDLAAVIASRFKAQIFAAFPFVVPQELSEIQNFNRVIALMSNYWNPEKTNMSYADMVDYFNRLDLFVRSGEISRDFYNRVFSNFAAIVATEVILLGNNWFSLSSVSLDTISGAFYSYASRDNYSISSNELSSISSPVVQKTADFSTFTKSIYPFRPAEGNLDIIMQALPSDYFKSLETLSLTIDGYPSNFDGILRYMESAIRLLKSRGAQ